MNEEEMKAALEGVAAENVALQTLVLTLLTEMNQSGQKHLVDRTFHRADLTLEATLLAMGDRAPIGHSREAMSVLEQFRKIVGIDEV